MFATSSTEAGGSSARNGDATAHKNEVIAAIAVLAATIATARADPARTWRASVAGREPPPRVGGSRDELQGI